MGESAAQHDPPGGFPEGTDAESAEAGLTTGGLARRLGVSPTTLRSWDRRYGIGPAVRAEGRHRRWTPQDVVVLETMCRLTSSGVPPAEAARAAREGGRRPASRAQGPARGGPSGTGGATGRAGAGRSGPGVSSGSGRSGRSGAEADEGFDGSGTGAPATVEPSRGPSRSRAAGGLPLGDVRQECRGLARAAVRLDAPAVEDHLAAVVGEHGLTVAWQEVMMPTLHAVGRKWASSGDRYVEVEHLLSWHVSTTLRRHTRAPGPQAAASAEPVVLACVPGEQHTLPLEALNAGLGELGVPARMFGAAVPAEALTAAVQRLGPRAVVLWAQSRSTASVPLARHVAATQWGVKGARRQPLVLLAGPGWGGRPVPGMPRPATLGDALDLLGAAYGAERSAASR
ncbi:MerR family transcriptional regulator [Streptomyces sp. NPDC005574]|uniref:MerR family transcriptional regulator n=1 Tax=Streptomyces sp. NPDC005574 TaxID=3156891 RepID=UPI00339E178D